MIKVVGISGSLRKGSSNTAVLKAIGNTTEKASVAIYESLITVPHFDPAISPEDSPASVQELRGLIKNADAVIICSPEYAFGVPGILKNALDWLVSSGELNEKPVGIITASPLHRGGNHAHDSLVLTLTALGAKMTDAAKIMIGNIYNKMDEEKRIVDEDTIQKLEQLMTSLIAACSKNNND